MKDILVIGESCLDIFIYCHSERLAPDFPVPILNVITKKENPGMAMNVQRNIETQRKCELFTNDNWRDVTKTRYVHEQTNHMFMRVDSASTVDRIDLSKLTLDYRLVVISDYNKGFLHEDDIDYICSRHPSVFLDTKKRLNSWAKGARYIKINDFEFRNSKPYTDKLYDHLIHTMGGDGCEFQGKLYGVERVDVKDTSGAGDSFIALTP